jgi:hypothetical protein
VIAVLLVVVGPASGENILFNEALNLLRYHAVSTSTTFTDVLNDCRVFFRVEYSGQIDCSILKTKAVGSFET